MWYYRRWGEGGSFGKVVWKSEIEAEEFAL